MLLENSLSNSDMSQSSKSKNLGNSEASWRHKHGTSPYLSDSTLGLLSQRKDEVGNSTDMSSSEQQIGI
ncbi:hypothetical protein CQW23_23661 [Capsicum baccatum]|uniref:Uncharacterized protein n=1 Tax=Capsicum baccatum TaxID=33114 RepID=A0A2G2VSL1_CAPBA|nr:hypothetical protein CQW23_23661 [Capsicum baccatum]